MKYIFFVLYLLLLFTPDSFGQPGYNSPEGNLFIIGGGERPLSMMQKLVSTARLTDRDYVVVLPMSSAEPDTAFYYIKSDLSRVCNNAIANLNFIKDKINDKYWLDSVKHAKLIFITGGDQGRFMNIVLNSPVNDAIHDAYKNGATIAGTSAGAAVMSKFMITGTELVGDRTYHETFTKLRDKNIELKEGLGLLDSVIVDQHFIARSRYNRLISALAKFPAFQCIGIDESTAIIVHKKTVTVTGDSQVILLSHPEGLQISADGLIKMNDVQLSIYSSGDEFLLHQ